jgi:1-acyl-sn-glycerol-3-phosphate acyltransferase
MDISTNNKFSLKTFFLLTSPLRLYFNPVFYGMKNIDSTKPALFVSNHTIYGVMDVPLMVAEIYKEKGFLINSLGDTRHYKSQIWSDFLTRGGMSHGDRETCGNLMKQKKNILVFPGGAHEVFKCKGEKYKLNWRERYGFVSMAIQYSYPIIPIAQVGYEDAYDILIDSNEMLATTIGDKIRKSKFVNKFLKNEENLPPIVRGLGLTSIPRPERLYFSIGKPIDTKKYNEDYKDKEALVTLKDIVKKALTGEINSLLNIREQDTETGLLRKILNRL